MTAFREDIENIEFWLQANGMSEAELGRQAAGKSGGARATTRRNGTACHAAQPDMLYQDAHGAGVVSHGSTVHHDDALALDRRGDVELLVGPRQCGLPVRSCHVANERGLLAPEAIHAPVECLGGFARLGIANAHSELFSPCHTTRHPHERCHARRSSPHGALPSRPIGESTGPHELIFQPGTPPWRRCGKSCPTCQPSKPRWRLRTPLPMRPRSIGVVLERRVTNRASRHLSQARPPAVLS